MSEDFPEVEVVPEIPDDQVRRYWILEHGAPYIFCDSQDILLELHEVFVRLKALEKWLIDGSIPEKPEKPADKKSKFTIVKGE